MKISDLARLSTDNLRRRKGRTALTVIGVVVGTCAIVVMISLGIAMNKQTDAMLQSYGDLTQIEIMNYSGGGSGSSETPALDDKMMTSIQGYDHVLAATPYYQMQNFDGLMHAGRNGRYESGTWQMYGLYPNAPEAMGFTLLSGTWLEDNKDYGKNKIPVVVGQNFAYSFYDSKRSENSPKRQRYSGDVDSQGNPVEPFFELDGTKLTLTYNDSDRKVAATYELVIVGVMQSDYSKGYFTDSGLIMRLSDMEKVEQAYCKTNKIKAQATNGYQDVYVKVDNIDNVEDVEAQIKDLGYDTYSMSQQREEMQKSVGKSQLILGGLAAISLLVAALNIMNTMTMAIYERTREIGVMKVLGCELNQIRLMFLIESGCIGLIGGVFGVVVSLLLSALLNHLTQIMAFFGGTVDLSWISQMMGSYMYDGSAALSIVPPWLILLALGFATLVGLLSGIAPAGRAVKISALEAIRHE
ncbi:MAG: ABC transporter permease [Faecalibacterium sp.]|jgi:ABC-type antimicrobial peptide transport system permease subunit|nr:ABC transporter permease [Faecalibacterium sp.]